MRKSLLNEPTDDKVTLWLITETKHEQDDLCEFWGVGNVAKIGIDSYHHMSNAWCDHFRPNIFDDLADELFEGKVKIFEEEIDLFDSFWFESYDIFVGAVGANFFLLILIDDLLERQSSFILFLDPFLGQSWACSVN